MALQVNIADDKIDNLSIEAQATLKEQIERYANDIIKEANLVEEGHREHGASTEITSNIILQAVRSYRIHRNKKTKRYLLYLKILSTLTLWLSGFLFDTMRSQNDSKVLFWASVIVLIIAVATTVLQFVNEERE